MTSQQQMACQMTKAIRRLKRDLDHLEKNPNPQLLVRPSGESMLEWHFVFYRLPAETPYGAGCYHGKITFPETYPMAPPALMMLTPNGRLQTNQRLCLSMTDFHPESWNPAWTVESLLVGVISFLVDDRDTRGIGSIAEAPEVRRSLALKSWDFNRKDAEFRELFPELLEEPGESAGPQTGEPTAHSGTASRSAEDTAAPVAVPAQADVDSDDVDIAMSEMGTAQEGSVAPVPRLLTVFESGAEQRRRSSDEELEAARRGGPAEEAGGRHEVGPDMAPALSAAECWICREDATDEPLIQPCECRGSMSGVHASCVEAWIAHHRSSAEGGELPKCSVCGVAYTGEEKRPGILRFVFYLCLDFLRQAVRTTILITLLVCYWAAAQPEVIEALPTRIALLTLSGGFFLYKALVLAVSMPRGRPPPTGVDRFLFTADFRSLAVILAELLAIVLISVLWCLYGHLHYYYVIPLLVLPVFPMATIVLNGQASPLRGIMFLLVVIASPVIVTIHVVKLIWLHPKRLVDPFDGVLHVLFPAATVCLSWFCESTTPVMSLWCSHIAIMLLGLLEKGLCKRAPWKAGRSWWIFVQLAILAAYIANLMYTFSSEEQDRGSIVVCLTSLLWLVLCCTLAVTVNWELCVRHFRAWQQRNGQFSLATRNGTGREDPAQLEEGQVIGRTQQ